MPADDDWFLTDSLQLLGRAVESSARMAGALFTHSPLQGQVNLLTTGAFDAPASCCRLERTRGVAFFSLGAPVGEHGDWTVKAALNQGDLSSWILTGNYVTRAIRRGIATSSACRTACTATRAATPRRSPRCPKRRATSAPCTRTTTGRCPNCVTIGYGGHYAHYDYLLEPAHFSPRMSATIQHRPSTRAFARWRRATCAAPGAEEFLPPSRAQVLPPQRTFAPLTRAGFLPEDMRHYELARRAACSTA